MLLQAAVHEELKEALEVLVDNDVDLIIVEVGGVPFPLPGSLALQQVIMGHYVILIKVIRKTVRINCISCPVLGHPILIIEIIRGNFPVFIYCHVFNLNKKSYFIFHKTY